MDTFFKRWGVIAYLAFAALGSADAFASPENSSYQYQGQALAGCNEYISDWLAAVEGRQQGDMSCVTSNDGAPSGKYRVGGHGGIAGRGYWFWTDASPNPCSGMSASSIELDGKVLEGSSTCVRGPVQYDGSQAMCGVNLSPISPPTSNQFSGGWHTYVRYSPTGTICGIGSGQNPGTITGPAGNTAPPIPSPPPPDTPNPPDVCDNASCYDPAGDQYCAKAGDQQFCVPGSSGRSPGGGCSSAGDVTLCAGSPNAPAPPPSSGITDAATEIGATGGTSQANPQTGAVTHVGTGVYAVGGMSSGGSAGGGGTTVGGVSVSNGQGTGDKGPAPASSSGDPAGSSSAEKPPGSYGGGGDCNNPPVCSGDAVMCGIARQEWRTMCSAKASADQARKDLVGDGSAPPSDHKTAADVWGDGNASSGDPLADNANKGIYDQSGFGAPTTCPLVDLEVPLWGGKSFAVPFSKGCTLLEWLRWIVIGFATFAAIKITAGGAG